MADQFKIGQLVNVQCIVNDIDFNSDGSVGYYFFRAPDNNWICSKPDSVVKVGLLVEDATDEELLEELKRRGRVLADMTRKK